MNLIIGIDPGLKTGVAVWDRATRRLREIRTSTFWEVYRWLVKEVAPESAIVVVENSALNKFTYRQRSAGAKQSIAERMSRNVGSNNRESELLIEGLRLAGFRVDEVRPTTGHGKLDAAQFTRITKWDGKTSQHGRDAAMLVFGR